MCVCVLCLSAGLVCVFCVILTAMFLFYHGALFTLAQIADNILCATRAQQQNTVMLSYLIVDLQNGKEHLFRECGAIEGENASHVLTAEVNMMRVPGQYQTTEEGQDVTSSSESRYAQIKL